MAKLPPPVPLAPNVLMIVLDDVGADRLRSQGRGGSETPSLDRLAARAVRFDEARATASSALPALASLLTGRWPHRLSVGRGRPLDDACPTLAEYLAQYGYATAGFVGNAPGANASSGLGRGFARYEDDDENRGISLSAVLRSSGMGRRLVPAPVASLRKTAGMIRRDALRWLDGRPDDRPFFLFLNFFEAHDGGLAALDRQVGLLLDDLERRGLLETTLLVVTSDHAAHPGPGPIPYEREVHVPLFVSLPYRQYAGRVVSEPVSLRDVPATVADLLDLDDDPPFPGRSLARTWEGRGQREEGRGKMTEGR